MAGERDGRVLAALRHARVHADEETIARSLRGTWRAEHLFALTQALQRWDGFQGQIQACEARIGEVLDRLGDEAEEDPEWVPAGRSVRERTLQRALYGVLGVDLTRIPTIGVETALVLASEIGPELSRFVDARHFCSWLTLAPGTRISGGKPLGGATPKRVNRAGQALRMAASTARRSESYIGATHRARLARLDAGRAVKATAHQLARWIYALMTRGEAYVERGLDAYESEHQDRRTRALRRNAARLGFTLQPMPAGSVA